MGAKFIYKDKKDCTIDETPQAFFAKLINIEAERRGLNCRIVKNAIPEAKTNKN